MGKEFNLVVEMLRKKLRDYSPQRLHKENATSAAVMILLTEVQDEPHILLTKRTELVEHHKGQISFPGGVRDREDESLLHTALRETEEEIGLPPEKIEVLGQIDDFYTVTNFLITPFVGIVRQPLDFRLSQNEVAEVLKVPLSLFLSDKYFEMKEWEYQGRIYNVYFYYFNQHTIWGATAFILNNFVELMFGYNPAPYSVREDPRNAHYLKENQVRRSH